VNWLIVIFGMVVFFIHLRRQTAFCIEATHIYTACPHLFVHSEVEVLRALVLEGSLLSTLFGRPSYTVADFLLFVNGRTPRCVWALQYLSFSFAWRVGAHHVFLFLASALVLGQCAFLGAHHLQSFPICQRDTPVSTLPM
jgi:hypothetical protein